MDKAPSGEACLDQMIETVMKVARGDYTVQIELSGTNDGFDSLAMGLNMMIDDVRTNVEELQESRERLLRSERLAAIGQLSAGVAHELRNPLGAIKNAAYYVKGRLKDSEMASENPRIGQFLEIMDEEIKSSNQIITDLMDFARVNPPSQSPTSLKSLVDSALARIELHEDLTVNTNIPPGLAYVSVDTEQLRRALGNLISNAADAMPGGGTLSFDARTRNGFAELAISDTGDGIEEKDIGKIFDPLFTTKPRGIGMGLAIVGETIRKHNGSIFVTSKQGEGTTFTIRLPVADAPANSQTSGFQE